MKYLVSVIYSFLIVIFFPFGRILRSISTMMLPLKCNFMEMGGRGSVVHFDVMSDERRNWIELNWIIHGSTLVHIKKNPAFIYT